MLMAPKQATKLMLDEKIQLESLMAPSFMVPGLIFLRGVKRGAVFPGLKAQKIAVIENGVADKPPTDAGQHQHGDKASLFQKAFPFKPGFSPRFTPPFHQEIGDKKQDTAQNIAIGVVIGKGAQDNARNHVQRGGQGKTVLQPAGQPIQQNGRRH